MTLERVILKSRSLGRAGWGWKESALAAPEFPSPPSPLAGYRLPAAGRVVEGGTNKRAQQGTPAAAQAEGLGTAFQEFRAATPVAF